MKDSLKVHAVTWYGSGVFALELERDDFAFIPGDCMALFTEDGRVSRPYSIASGVGENVLRFVIRLMPGGTVSGYLAGRKPGDLVRVSPPFGWFHPGEKHMERPFAFIATGTGVAPFLSHFRTRTGIKPAAFLYGVREFTDIVDLQLLQQAGGVQVALSREQRPGFHHGRVTGLLDQLPLQPEMDYYLCGLDAMIDETTDWLEDKGVDITRIHRECFFNSSYAT